MDPFSQFWPAPVGHSPLARSPRRLREARRSAYADASADWWTKESSRQWKWAATACTSSIGSMSPHQLPMSSPTSVLSSGDACAMRSASGDLHRSTLVCSVQPPMPGDPRPSRPSSLLNSVAALLVAPTPATPAEAKRWPNQVDTLRSHVQAWTGNVLQVVDLSVAEWINQQQSGQLAEEVRRDAIEMLGSVGIGRPAPATKKVR